MFQLNLDTMHVSYSDDDKDLALAFVDLEGLTVRWGSAENSVAYLVPHGADGHVWTRRVFRKGKKS